MASSMEKQQDWTLRTTLVNSKSILASFIIHFHIFH